MSTAREQDEVGCCRTKYQRELRHLIPFRPSSKDSSEMPVKNAGLYSYMSVSWLAPLMKKAYKEGLQACDLWALPLEEGSEVNSQRLEKLWEDEIKCAKDSRKQASLWRCVWRFTRTRVVLSCITSVFVYLIAFLTPSVYLRLILSYINDPVVNYLYAATLVVFVALSEGAVFIFLNNTMFLLGIHTGARLTGALQAVMYKKALRIKSGGESLSAHIINICNNDMERIFEACMSCVFLVFLPVAFLATVVYSIYIIGPWAILGQVVYLIVYPIMGVIGAMQSRVRLEAVKVTDHRVSVMSEILNNMRLIKIYSWEEAFAKTIAGIRKKEMRKHRKAALLSAVDNTLFPGTAILATITTILGYTLTGNELTSEKAFILFSVFNSIGFTVAVLPYTVRTLVEAKVSLNRIQKVLTLPEYRESRGAPVSKGLAVQIKAATFAWEELNINFKEKHVKDNTSNKKAKKDAGASVCSSPQSSNYDSHRAENKVNKSVVNTVETLFNIDIDIECGKLVGVCGSVGSGKSSLISAICGDMKEQEGSMLISGHLALVTQQAWIYSGTLRENILTGMEYNQKKYSKVIECCCLEPDLELLPHGDATEIGERGINLSGGQKQRVNLARAVYSDRDIYLLDDPLSAVDTVVAQTLFDKCIKGLLQDKTVILVTHATHILEKCEKILVMAEGRIVESGTHCQLLAKQGRYYSMMGCCAHSEDDNQHHNSSQMKDTPVVNPCGEGVMESGEAKLIQEEKKVSGGVGLHVYLQYMKAAGGWPVMLLLLLFVIGFNFSQQFSTIWLQMWLDEGDGAVEERRQNVTKYNLTLSGEDLKGNINLNPQLWMYQTVYGLCFVILFFTGILKSAGVSFSMLSGSSKLHNSMLASILHSPISFFDTTPTGRILNRFSYDLDELDVRLPMFLESLCQNLLYILAQLILASIIYVWFIIPVIIIVGLFVLLDSFLSAGVLECKRLDNNLRSPVVQHIGSSMSGLSVIRALDREEHFTYRLYRYLDEHTVARMVFNLAARWLTFRAEYLALAIRLSIIIVCLFTKGIVSTAVAGLALTSIFFICDAFPYIMRIKSFCTSHMTSAERIIEYSEELKSEAPWEVASTQPSADWPSLGAVEMRDVKLRYRPDLPLVLHGIEASIMPGEKIGIVGRTGAGKSSLISTLMRLVELDSGCVLIDGVDISTLGLHTLRSTISAIPQDPVLFQGSIRYNLDPLEEHSDEAVWQALERSHLKDIVQQQEHGLYSKVEAAGENFSVGERQLICLTRALLRNSKILVLDEATAFVDKKTDQLIQATIKEAFASSTILTVAHRLNTVLTYDRILVLDAGRVQEFERPEVLMKTEGSVFRDMMQAMAIYNVEEMKELT